MKLYFDLDDTLYDRVQPFARACKQVFPHLLAHPVQEVYDTFQHYSEQVFGQMQNGEMSLQDLHVYRCTKMCEHYGYVIDRTQALTFQEAYQSNQTKIELSQDMENLLDALVAKQVRIGIITNGDAAHQRMKIKQLGLERWFKLENIFISGEVGIMKPNLEIFEMAGTGDDYLYVGDSYANDVVGAKNAGWKCIWLKKKDVASNEVKADYVVYNEQELCQLIRELFALDK